jgi:hypothetical protein
MITITIDTTGIASALGNTSRLRAALSDSRGLHAVMAEGAERFVKARGAVIAGREHATANRLGARPTKHLAKAYDAIESTSDAVGAKLLVPRASRLRAAFGAYTQRPTGGRKYLTIPVSKEGYGKRASEVPDLVFMRIGPRRTPVLAKRPNGGASETLQVIYVLLRQVTHQADPNLIPMNDLTSEARDIAERYMLEAMQEGGAS